VWTRRRSEAVTEELKLVVVVRTDLGLTKGKLAVQVAHASVNCAMQSYTKRRRVYDDWYRGGQKKIVAKVPSMRELLELKSMAEAKGLVTSLVSDAGLTQVPPGTTTCLGIGPATSAEVDPLTGHLGLL
jgi:PTH2 family peptidyl-tRNA hydrolase